MSPNKESEKSRSLTVTNWIHSFILCFSLGDALVMLKDSYNYTQIVFLGGIFSYQLYYCHSQEAACSINVVLCFLIWLLLIVKSHAFV